MIQKIKSKLAVILTSLAVVLPVAVPVTVAAGTTIQGGLCQGTENLVVNTAGGETCEPSGINSANANESLTKVINIISAIVGVIAVLMIVYGGFKYITSGGDSGKVGSAKTTILYAMLGLAIVAIAQIIVRFVVGTSNDLTS